MSEPIDDYDEIVRICGLYMEGASKGDVGKLKEAFHEDARMFGQIDSWRYDGPITDFFDSVAAKPADTGAYRGRVLSVQQVGSAALAVVAEDGYWGSLSFIDFLSLARIDGKWKIVNKTFECTGGEPPAA
jgi:hypothetical protein